MYFVSNCNRHNLNYSTVAHKGFTKQQNVLYLLDELDDTHREKCSKTGRASPETLQNLRRYIRNLKVLKVYSYLSRI